MKNYIKLFAVLILFISGCKKTEVLPYELPEIKENSSGGYPSITKQVPYYNIALPTDPQQLVFDEDAKDINISKIQDTVVVFIEGGPTHKAEPATLKQIKEAINENGFPKYSVIGLRQSHNLNPTVFGSGTGFTANNAQEVNNQTIEIVEKVISWLNTNKKVVYLFGHSNGSFMVQNYMTTGKAKPKGYIISATRLKPAKGFLDNYPNNIDVSFKNGVIVEKKNISQAEFSYFNVLTKLQLNHMKDYKTLLNNNAMLPNTFYSLAGNDEAVGALEQDERDFLKNNKVTHLLVAEWGHGEAALGVLSALARFRKK